jgi:hypothetical protein
MPSRRSEVFVTEFLRDALGVGALGVAHPGGAGLLWAIHGGRLVELHRDWAVIELAANGSRHVFERRRIDAGNVTLPWIERGRRPGDV